MMMRIDEPRHDDLTVSRYNRSLRVGLAQLIIATDGFNATAVHYDSAAGNHRSCCITGKHRTFA